LNYNNQDSYKTSIGGIASIAITLFIFFAFFDNIKSFINKDDVTSLSLIRFEEDPASIELSDEWFMMALNIEQEDYNTNPYFNITV
jgi:hypothetical protein